MADDLVSEARISDGPADACTNLLASTSEALDSLPAVIVLHDRAANRLIEIGWLPGRGMIPRATPLAGNIGKDVISASIAGDRLTVSDSTGAIHLIDRYAGSVSRVAPVAGPAVMTPDGRSLIVPADRGLLTVGLWSGNKGQPAFAAGIEPFAMRRLDHPGSMLLIPDNGTDELTLIVGCYGAIELATFAAGVARHRDPSPVRWRTLPAEGLTHDPILLASPPLIVPAPDGPLVYATDSGATGLIAIDFRSGAVTRYPRNGGGYATLRAALACLDSSACLISERDAGDFLWSPGSDPRPVAMPKGRPVAWTRTHMLVLERDRAILRETAAPGA